ncbi:putative electron transfer flavoprotein-ubiquinone oxidoreductase, partial [Colletotrichum sp. SAR 10_65]
MSSASPLARSLQRSTRNLSRCRYRPTHPAQAQAACLSSTTSRRTPTSRLPSTRAASSSVTVFRPLGARTFTTSRPRRSDEEEDFDPASIERESDQVDVCIVGG